MYILYWYIVLITFVSVIVELYTMMQANNTLTPTDKLGAVVGLVLRQSMVCVFLVLVYPALAFVQ